jgi:phage-related protein
VRPALGGELVARKQPLTPKPRPVRTTTKGDTVRTNLQRKDGYAAKNIAATVSLKVASRLGGMKTNFGTAMQSLVPIETTAQGILNGIGTIPTMDYPVYYNFVRQVWSIKNKGITGVALTLQAQGLSSYYQDVGYSAPALIALAAACFTLTVT